MDLPTSNNQENSNTSSKFKRLHQCKRCWEAFSFAFQLRHHLGSHLLKSPDVFVLDMKESSNTQISESPNLWKTNEDNGQNVASLSIKRPSLANNKDFTRSKRFKKMIAEKTFEPFQPALLEEAVVDDNESDLGSSVGNAIEKVAERSVNNNRERIKDKRSPENNEMTRDQDIHTSNDVGIHQQDSSVNKSTEKKGIESTGNMSHDNTSACDVQEDLMDQEQAVTNSLAPEEESTEQLISRDDTLTINGQGNVKGHEPSGRIVCKISRSYLESTTLVDIGRISQNFANKLSGEQTSAPFGYSSAGDSAMFEPQTVGEHLTRNLPSSRGVWDFEEGNVLLEDLSNTDGNNNCAEADLPNGSMDQHRTVGDVETSPGSEGMVVINNGETCMTLQDVVSVEKMMSLVEYVELASSLQNGNTIPVGLQSINYENQLSFLCHECGVSFNKKCSLARHLSVHRKQFRKDRISKFKQAGRQMKAKSCNMDSIVEPVTLELECQITKQGLRPKPSNDTHSLSENTLKTGCSTRNHVLTANSVSKPLLKKLKQSGVKRRAGNQGQPGKRRGRKPKLVTEKAREGDGPLPCTDKPITSTCSTDGITEAEEVSQPVTLHIISNENPGELNVACSTNEMENSSFVTEKTALNIGSSPMETLKKPNEIKTKRSRSGVSARTSKFKWQGMKKEILADTVTKSSASGEVLNTVCSKKIGKTKYSKKKKTNNLQWKHYAVHIPENADDLFEKPSETKGQSGKDSLNSQLSTDTLATKSVLPQSKLCKNTDNPHTEAAHLVSSEPIPISPDGSASVSNKTVVRQSDKNDPMRPCKFCHKMISRSNIRRHVKHHCSALKKPSSDWVKCSICLNSIMSNSLEKHIARFHQLDSDPKQLTCIVCDKTGFESFQAWADHRKMHEVEVSNVELTSNEKMNRSFPGCGHFCLICKTEKLSADNIQSHVIGHVLDKNFNKMPLLKDKQLMCPACLKPFSKKKDIRCHILSHWKIKLFVCPLCNRRYASYSSLQKHAKQHKTDSNS